jgi:2-polyprenyl-3-methyl-5-hydroxy-6-metoxy-1,4-benzoquinol methylase
LAFEELKERQAAMGSSGPYQGITETITDIHRRVIDRLQPQRGQRFFDLARGTGAVAEAAAQAEADVELHDESRADGSLHFSRRYLLTVGTRR